MTSKEARAILEYEIALASEMHHPKFSTVCTVTRNAPRPVTFYWMYLSPPPVNRLFDQLRQSNPGISYIELVVYSETGVPYMVWSINGEATSDAVLDGPLSTLQLAIFLTYGNDMAQRSSFTISPFTVRLIRKLNAMHDFQLPTRNPEFTAPTLYTLSRPDQQYAVLLFPRLSSVAVPLSQRKELMKVVNKYVDTPITDLETFVPVITTVDDKTSGPFINEFSDYMLSNYPDLIFQEGD